MWGDAPPVADDLDALEAVQTIAACRAAAQGASAVEGGGAGHAGQNKVPSERLRRFRPRVMTASLFGRRRH
jgi:hypothetical protein